MRDALTTLKLTTVALACGALLAGCAAESGAEPGAADKAGAEKAENKGSAAAAAADKAEKAAPAKPSPAEIVAARKKAEAIAPLGDAPMKDFEGDDDEVELYSAAVTAYPCAAKAAKKGKATIADGCSPMSTLTHGFALLDPSEKKVYLVKKGAIYGFEMEHGFGGRMDISGTVVGTKAGLPVIEPESYSITPKPKPGAFKGCL